MKSYRVVQSGSRHRAAAKEKQQRQMRKLLWVLVLLLGVLVGKRTFPGQLAQAGEQMQRVLAHSIDLEDIFRRLGGSLTEGDALEGLEKFCVEVSAPPLPSDRTPEQQTAAIRMVFPVVSSGMLDMELQKTRLILEDEPSESVPIVPAVGTVLNAADETGQAPPEGYTTDELSFGELETISPVLGHLNSGFGYREHPLNGKYTFHSGVDISADAGDDIAAFAEGIVEFVGEDDTYGLYVQLDHGEEIKSFYAHCQQVFVKKGERVAMGERIALVGSSGRATGPHLHLELKCCGKRVDPAYYVDFL